MFSFTKQACVDCHFFVKESHGLHSGLATFEITEKERKKASAGDYSWQKEHYTIACNFGVWDEGHNFDPSKKHEIVVQTNRCGFCFFWKRRSGMLLPAAKILQQREAEHREARRDRRHTIYGLWIAVMALLVNILTNIWLRLAERFSWWPFK